MKLVVSITSVSPSHLPTGSPSNIGSSPSRCGRPSSGMIRVLRWNSCTITRWFFVWKNCIALPERTLAGKPAGMQKSRGSSCLGSPVRGSKNASPPGLSGAKLLAVEDRRVRAAALRVRQVCGPLVRAAEVGLAVCGSRDGARALRRRVLRRAPPEWCNTVSAPTTSASSSQRGRSQRHDWPRATSPVALTDCRSSGVAVKTLRPSGVRHLAAEAVVRSVLGPEAFDVDDRSDNELILRDAAPHQLAGCAARQPPRRRRAVRVLHLDVVPDVRVVPLDLRERARELDRLACRRTPRRTNDEREVWRHCRRVHRPSHMRSGTVS